MRAVAREFITHNGCAPRSLIEEGDDDEGHELAPSDFEPDEAGLLEALQEARADSGPVDREERDGGQGFDPAHVTPGDRVIEANRQLGALKEARAGMDHVTPCFSSTGCWNPDYRRGTGDEAKQVHRRADHRGAAGAGDRRIGGRALSQARDVVGDVLRLEGEVRRYGGVRGEAAEGA